VTSKVDDVAAPRSCRSACGPAKDPAFRQHAEECDYIVVTLRRAELRIAEIRTTLEEDSQRPEVDGTLGTETD